MMPFFFLLQLLTIVGGSDPPNFSDAKCGSCLAIADEVKISQCTVDTKANMDLDLGGRIDGNRRRINYADSEVRTLDILGSVCRSMGKYTLVRKDEVSYFQRKSEVTNGAITFGGQHTEATIRELRSYCYHILEEHEDRLHELIRYPTETEATIPDIRTSLCVDTLGICDLSESEDILEALGPIPSCIPEPTSSSSSGQSQESPPSLSGDESQKKKKTMQKKKKRRQKIETTAEL